MKGIAINKMTGEPFRCDCGRLAVRHTSARQHICARCAEMEMNMNRDITAMASAGFAQEGRLFVPLPSHHGIEPPIAGASLLVLNRMLSMI